MPDLIELSTPAMLVGGALEPASDGRCLEVVNPGTGERLATAPFATAEDVDRAVRAARRAAVGWGRVPVRERADHLLRLAAALRAHQEELAVLDALNSGNPIREMRRDVLLAVAVIEYYAGIGSELKGETLPLTPETLHFSVREPYGVVGRIVAFNHPLLFAASRLAAPLVAGNAVVLKPADQTPLSALALGRIAADLFPPGIVNVVPGDGPTTGAALVRHPDVKRIAFIGSVETGRLVQRQAAEAGVKHVTLELGGKNPMIVFPDADAEAAAAAAVRGMNFVWQGQSCGSTTRLFVHRRLHDRVVAGVLDRVRAIKVGDPMVEDTQMGPMISKRQLDKDLSYIAAARDEGGTVLTGGGRPPGLPAGGFYLEPTVVGGVRPGMRVAQEEIFGPVLSVLEWDDYDAMIAAANGVRYGLTASIWTNDINQALRTMRAVEAGYVWINDVSIHYLGAGFGGYKESGVGKEENLAELLSYTQEKYVHIRTPAAGA
jgi:acyl-CoA reductase-like NAD-dependent aldehyde dehydrogenase